MNEYYRKDKLILLYGAGSTAKILYHKLKDNKLNINGFIDRRAHIIKKFEGVEVLGIEDIKHFINKEDYVIIITTRNVFEHTLIANKLFDLGFKNLIFKPYSFLKGYPNETSQKLSEVHDSYLVKMEDYIDKIPEYNGKEEHNFTDKAIILKEKGMIKVFVPAELLYTNVTSASRWDDMNFISTYIAVKLYKAFELSQYQDFEFNINEYIIKFAKEGAIHHGVNTDGNWDKILIDSRIKSYSEMTKLFALNYNFFIDNCTTVELVDNRKMRLVKSGKNRVSFLIAKGIKFIPVNMSKVDYFKFINENALFNFINYLVDNNIQVLFSPIAHPYFYDFRYEANNYVELCLARVGSKVSDFVLDNKKQFSFNSISLVNALHDSGSLERHLNMMGVKTYRNSIVEDDICKQIDCLFNYEPIIFDSNSHFYFDIGIFSNKLPEIVVYDMLKIVVGACFFIVWDDGLDYEKLLQKNGFKVDEVLFSTIWKEVKVKGVWLRKE